MKHRIFIALPVDLDIQKEASLFQKKYTSLPVRWIKGNNLHCTIIPPWYTQKPEMIIGRLKKVKGLVKSFAMIFEEVAFGPDPKKPRLIWAGGQTPEEIICLKKELEMILDQKAEKRPYRLHLTIARFRETDFHRFSVKTLTETINWRQPVSSFVLMESHLSSSGATYQKLAEFT